VESFWFDKNFTNFLVWKLTNFDEWKCVFLLWEMNSYNHCFSIPKVYIRGWYCWLFSSVESRGWKLGSMGYFNIRIKFFIDRVPSCRLLEFWDFGRIGGRPQALTTKLNTILMLRPFKRALICPILKAGTKFLLEKSYFSWSCPSQGQISGLQDHGSQIPDRTICN
jgi:hypothetical protein